MAYNITHVAFGTSRRAKAEPIIYQHDVTQILVINGLRLPEYYVVDFCNEGSSNVIPITGTADGVEIPDELIATGKTIKAYIVIDGIQTRYEVKIPVNQRPPREDIDPDEGQQQAIDALVAALNSGVSRAETAATEAEEAAQLLQNPSAEATTLEPGSPATASYDDGTFHFGLPQGPQGDPFTYEDFTEEQKEELVQGPILEAQTTAVGAVNRAGSDQVSAVNQAGTTNVNAVNRAGTTQVGNVNQAGTTQVRNVNEAGATQVQTVEDKGREVIESIPADYTALDATVTSLNRQLSDVEENQIPELKSNIGEHSSIISANLMGVDVQQNLYSGAADWSGTWLNSDTINMGVSDVTFEGYQTVYSSQSWRRYCKNIPVEAGKTYTFEAWIKHAQAGPVSIFLTNSNLTTNPATVSPASRQWNNIPADVWKKVSLTFTCTASGNITPFALSGNSAFYIAKYNLVEGDSVFSLDNALAGKASIESVSGIGDYLRYDFSIGTSLGTYWNPIIDKEIPTGTKVKLIFDYYSGEYLSYVRIDGKKTDDTWQNDLCRIDAPVHGGEAEFTAAEKYVALRVQFSRSQNESNVEAMVYLATNSKLGITNELMGMQSQRVFHVEKDGNGDFTSLVEAVNTACQYLDSVVYVGAGEWDIIDEFGAAYMEAVSSNKSTWGLWLKNRIHLIGTAKTVIKAVNASGSTNFENIKEYFSVFNAGEKGFTLENISIEDENIRYSVHDDRGWSGPEPYTNKYIRCSMIHKNGKYSDCIGGGIGENCAVEIRGCYFEGASGRPRLAYYHGNNNASVTNAKANIVVCDNYFAQDGTFQLTNYGNSTTVSKAFVSNNSFGTAPSVTDGSSPSPIIVNMELVEWNNIVRT